jgi:hypothetical protein
MAFELRVLRALLLGLVCAATVGASALANGEKKSSLTFGDKPSFETEATDYGLSPDKQALTITFNGLEAALGTETLPPAAARRARSPKTDAPIATRTYAVVIPVTSGGPIRTSFFASGFVLTNVGTNAAVVFSINGQSKIVRFGANENREFIVELRHRAKVAGDIRLSIFLLAERDEKNPTEGVFINVLTVDSDLALQRKTAAEKGKK